MPSSACASARNPVCYVLEAKSFTDLALLQNACVRLKLARPKKRLFAQAPELRSFFYLSRPRGFWDERRDRRAPAFLVRLIEVAEGPIRMLRRPDTGRVFGGARRRRKGSWLRLLVVEGMGDHEPLRKFLQVLHQWQEHAARFHEPVSLRSLLSECGRRAGAGAACDSSAAHAVCKTAHGAHRT